MKKILIGLLLVNFLFAQNKTIVLANETSWAPHYGKDLLNGGYTTEIIVEAMKRVGYDVKIKWLNWNRALELSKRGIYDGLGASYYTEERAKFFAYTDSLSDTQTVFFKLKSSNIKYNNFEDLKGYKIGTAKGYGYPKKFLEANYLKTENVRKLELNIKKLLRKRIDLMIGSKKVTQHLLNTKYLEQKDDIEVVKPSVDSMPLYVSFSKKSKGYEQKVKDFNKGLKIIKADGTFEKIIKKHGF